MFVEMWAFSEGGRKPGTEPSLNMASKPLAITAAHWTKARGRPVHGKPEERRARRSPVLTEKNIFPLLGFEPQIRCWMIQE